MHQLSKFVSHALGYVRQDTQRWLECLGERQYRSRSAAIEWHVIELHKTLDVEAFLSHRIAADAAGPERDLVAYGRYVDRMEQRDASGGSRDARCSSTSRAPIQSPRASLASVPREERATEAIRPTPCA